MTQRDDGVRKGLDSGRRQVPEHVVDEPPARSPTDPTGFDLEQYFPYRVRIFYKAVSQSVSRIYGDAYGLSPAEWRTMAILGIGRSLSATEIVARSSMDKIAVSRAVKQLREAGLLKRDIDGDDRRKSALRLTDRGVAIYSELIPQVQALEERLFAGLSVSQKEVLLSLMEHVSANAVPEGNGAT